MLEVSLLGQFEVVRDGKHVTISSRNAQALLAYLILNAGQAQRRERLAGLLWPDSSEENARSNLRHELWRLRKALSGAGAEQTECDFLVVDDLTLSFDAHSSYTLDVRTLESATPEGSSAEDLIAALAVYRGQLLPGFYHDWVFVERERLQALFEARLKRLLELLQDAGRWAEVQEWATRWIAVGDPWPELAYRALITAYASSGDVPKAMQTYERLAQGMQADIGLQPSQQTQALLARLQAGWKVEDRAQKEAKPPSSPTPAKVLPLTRAPRQRRDRLPQPLTSFIGRTREIEQVQGMVGGARLVTITGPGGVGKTRLAIQVAAALAPQFDDGLTWIELAPLLPGQDLVARAIAKALRLPDAPGVKVLDMVGDGLGDSQVLLVLDNCEHVIASCAVVVEKLLGDCPRLTVMATSREPLGVPGEKAWLLPSLSLPPVAPAQGMATDSSRVVQSEAVRLFLERAADASSAFQPTEADTEAIAHICMRLDGIPLAIELAAARMNFLSAGEIAARLGSRFSLLTVGRRTALPRHQTLQAAIEWSYDLLSAPEQRLFRRLAVFAGSFTLEAAEAVCG